MARQARSEVTRRKIMDAAVDLFSDRGYAATGLGDIIERAAMTRGAFYYHFDSKESLAAALIDESAAAIRGAFDGAASTAPALETMIHGVFVVADLVRSDRLVRSGMQLARAMGDFADAASEAYRGWLDAMSAQASRAQTEHDVRADLDPTVVSEVVVSATLGTELISNATSDGTDLADRLSRTWEVLLSAIATAESAPYFRQFLARESLRRTQPALVI